jgi:HlyD family secretion protein
VPEQSNQNDRPQPRLAPVDGPQLPLLPPPGTALSRGDVPNPNQRIAERQIETNLPRVYDGNQRIANRPAEAIRDKLTAGVAFLVNRDKLALASSPGDSLSIGVGRAYENELRTGLRVLIAGVVLIGGWAGFVPLSGAVTVPGNLVVQSNVKAIQHPTGGVVAEIAVNNGMRVEPGQLLVRLDATQARSSLQVLNKQLDDFRAKIARLVAERDGLSEPEFPAELTSRSAEPGVKAILASELSQFNARTNVRNSQRDLLQSRVTQLGEEISGLDSQLKSKASQLDLISGELKGVQDLFDKRLVPLTRLTTLQRESARIDGERGQLVSTTAETKAKIGEAQLQIVKIDQDFRTEVVKELNESQAKEAELAEHAVAAKDQLDRIELRAPTAGIVNQLTVHTIGGVIRAGDTIMEVVPDSDDLQIEAHVQPKDIDEVRMGQTALVAFSALNARTTPKLNGVVSYVSADASKDKDQIAPGGPVFTVRVMIPEEERRRLAGAQLVAGMPAELFMKTGSHTMLSYLFKPITEQLGHAFVER